MTSTCELCAGDGGIVLLRCELFRVVRVESADFPGFCRVIANRHTKEMTDLLPDERADILASVMRLESTLLRLLTPDKINLASLGNVTPHVHWHVIPRWRTDIRFPEPIWGPPLRAGSVPALPSGFDTVVATELRSVRDRR